MTKRIIITVDGGVVTGVSGNFPEGEIKVDILDIDEQSEVCETGRSPDQESMEYLESLENMINNVQTDVHGTFVDIW